MRIILRVYELCYLRATCGISSVSSPLQSLIAGKRSNVCFQFETFPGGCSRGCQDPPLSLRYQLNPLAHQYTYLHTQYHMMRQHDFSFRFCSSLPFIRKSLVLEKLCQVQLAYEVQPLMCISVDPMKPPMSVNWQYRPMANPSVI